MNKKIFSAFILLAVLVSCKKDSNSTPISTSNVTSTISSGAWRVSYYWDTDHDETSNFSGYSFQFNSNGTVTATKTSTVVSGIWSTLNDDSKVKLVLGFTSPDDFDEISDDWHTVERTDSKIRLQDISGGNGGTDYLTFEKN